MGSLFCKSKRSNRKQFNLPVLDKKLKEIKLTDEKDIIFAKTNNGKNVSGLTLPSGLEIPDSNENKKWVIKGNNVELISE